MIPSTSCHLVFISLYFFVCFHMYTCTDLYLYLCVYIYIFASWITLFLDSVSSLIVRIKSIFLCHKTQNGESGNSDKIKHMILFFFFLSLREIGAFERYKHLI